MRSSSGVGEELGDESRPSASSGCRRAVSSRRSREHTQAVPARGTAACTLRDGEPRRRPRADPRRRAARTPGAADGRRVAPRPAQRRGVGRVHARAPRSAAFVRAADAHGRTPDRVALVDCGSSYERPDRFREESAGRAGGRPVPRPRRRALAHVGRRLGARHERVGAGGRRRPRRRSGSCSIPIELVAAFRFEPPDRGAVARPAALTVQATPRRRRPRLGASSGSAPARTSSSSRSTRRRARSSAPRRRSPASRSTASR